MKSTSIVISSTLALLVGTPAWSQTSPKPAPSAPPPYTPVRWNEDYSYLKDPARRTGFLDDLKYIPLDNDGDIYLSLGGQARYRYEYFDNANFGAGAQDDDGFHLLRLMAHADLHVTKHFRFFAQGISALADGREGGDRPTDQDELDLHQGFADLKFDVGNAAVTLRGGRQNLLYGAQRLISPLDWTNVRRTFDGFKGIINTEGNQLDLFAVRPVIVDENEFNDNDDDQLFAGGYDVRSLPGVFGKSANSKLDLYFLYLERETPTFAAESETYTIGARFASTPKPWDIDIEADYQFGDSGSSDISAWSFAIEGGYTFANGPLAPRFYLGFDIASGDDDATDDEVNTHNQLFPLGHAYFGYIDAIGRQNIIDLHPGVVLNFTRKVNLRVDYHLFWREAKADGVYNAGGALLLAAGGSDERFIGSEIDLLLNWNIDRHILAYFGYSHFFAGDFVDDAGVATGFDEDIDFAYAALVFTF